MNFDEAVEAHVNWKVRLRGIISGAEEQVDPVVLSADNACALGKWIYGEGAKYSSLPAYAEVKALHADFHRIAGKIARLAKAGKKAEAQAALDADEYYKASTAVVMAINKLRNVAK